MVTSKFAEWYERECGFKYDPARSKRTIVPDAWNAATKELAEKILAENIDNHECMGDYALRLREIAKEALEAR